MNETIVIAPLHINSARLRTESDSLIFRAQSLLGQMRIISDELVLTRAIANKLRDEARRLEELRRQLENNDQARRLFIESIRFTDCDIFDDPELLIEINAADLECERCGRSERLVAVVRFKAPSELLAICGGCFQKLSEISLGAVV